MKRGSSAGTVAVLILTCIFGVTLLLSLLAGANVFRNVEARTEEIDAQRVGISYITAKLHGYDQNAMIKVAPYGDGDAVYLTEDMNGLAYDTILYVYDGYLRELLCVQGWDPGPESGQTIALATELSVTEPASGLLHISFQDGFGRLQSADVFLRSGG